VSGQNFAQKSTRPFSAFSFVQEGYFTNKNY